MIVSKTDPLEFHKSGYEKATSQGKEFKRKQTFIAWLRLFLFLIIPFGIWIIYHGNSAGYFLTAAGIISFLVAVRWYIKLERSTREQLIITRIHLQELAAIGDDITSFDAGLEFTDTKHPFSYDLDVFGRESLFQHICRTVTLKGKTRLAELLSDPVNSPEAIKARQEFVSSLASDPSFSTEFRTAGKMNMAENSSLEGLETWLKSAPGFLRHKWIRSASFFSPAIIILLLILNATIGLSTTWLWLPIGFNSLLLGRYLAEINKIHGDLSTTSSLIAQLSGLLSVTGKYSFSTIEFQQIKKDSADVSQSINKLYKIFNTFDLRLNMIAGAVLNLFFLFDFHCLFSLKKWKSENSGLLKKSLENMESLDVYQSLSMFAFHRPGNIYPEITAHNYEIIAENLAHPLIGETAVGNILSLGKDEQLILLTGANMTGKSTWLRTIGLNCIVAYAGLPVSATKAVFPVLQLYTSMRITDSLETGISYFRAELNRLKNMLDQLRQAKSNWLVLLDEPLRGTNSGDKQSGTIGLISNLLKLPATAIVATHDAALCDLEIKHQGKISNYHFDSTISGLELTFDYTLKRGCSVSNNATLLMKLTGILD